MNQKPTLQDIERLHELYVRMGEELHKTIIGQDDIIDQSLIAMFTGGHALLTGVPGLAKTLLVNSLATIMGLSFKRVQFTPDLMPTDIIGAEILDRDREFKHVKGPIFTNILLADEINRTPPKTQAALLEAMQEKAVTVSGVRYPLPYPFFVLATQNPIEQEGTYPLPEAQLDRFMFNLILDYPTHKEEVEIVKNTTIDFTIKSQQVLQPDDIKFYRSILPQLPVTDHIIEFAVSIVEATRPNRAKTHRLANEYLAWGAGPRASQYLVAGAVTHGALHGKPTPEMSDVIAVVKPTLRHRIVKNFKAEAEGITTDFIIDEIVSSVKSAMAK
ncbi:MAG TPA: AAA family ATPase [Salinivirgaceae bacterium]|nr:AAA family ATPase [Salinivirgaceae bacterium]